MSAEGDGEYKIGFGRPPEHTRFKKGRSGNPRGRPKDVKNLATLLGKTLSERVIVNEHGRRRSISKLEAAVKQLVNKAASGDPKFMQQLLALVQLAESRADASVPLAEPLTEADRRVIEGISERISRQHREADED
jgi:hypothetical protein